MSSPAATTTDKPGPQTLGSAAQRPEVAALQAAGRLFHQRGWSVGTSSNYSVLLSRDPLRLLLTASGMDKGRLRDEDFVIVDQQGQRVDPAEPKPSAETMLHVVLAQQPGVGAVLHTHSVWGTLLSDLDYPRGAVTIEGYEMLKGLAGIATHDTRVNVEIFENTQDIPALAEQLSARLNDAQAPLKHAFLIRRHGLYTWGADLEEARRHVEILEFLFEVVARRRMLAAAMNAG